MSYCVGELRKQRCGQDWPLLAWHRRRMSRRPAGSNFCSASSMESCHRRPSGKHLALFQSPPSPDASYFRAPLTSATTILSAVSTAATSARCSIPHSDGCAVHSTLPKGIGYTTLELKVNLIRSLNDKVGPVRAEGKTIHVGSRVGIAEATITDVDGKLYAHATTTCFIFPLP